MRILLYVFVYVLGVHTEKCKKLRFRNNVMADISQCQFRNFTGQHPISHCLHHCYGALSVSKLNLITYSGICTSCTPFRMFRFAWFH